MAATPLRVFGFLVHTFIPLRSVTNTLNDLNAHLVRTQKSMLHKCPLAFMLLQQIHTTHAIRLVIFELHLPALADVASTVTEAYLLSLPFCKRECLSAPDRSVHTYVFRRVMALPGMLFYTHKGKAS